MMGKRFVEVYVRASVEECERRDVKGLYEQARAGEIEGFTGVSDPYEEPRSPELLIDTEQESPQESAERLVALVEERLERLRGRGRGLLAPPAPRPSPAAPSPSEPLPSPGAGAPWACCWPSSGP